ncbi:MAG: TGS domain-containing protein, partial [Bacteroidales bacterium]|nr:TGS domain-containing protein [Bacteroidales bacterium]
IESIYDLFAIRIIIDCDLKDEKAECWRAYSVVTDMYKPNPARLKDWISVPKSNGYESLHITVFGPGRRWVEVQIRTKRMDEVAEKGFAAHWKYKGIKTEENMELWLANIREVLENPELNGVDFIEDFKLNLYDKEVFAFTPKGDLRRLAKGATILDFAFDIHTNVGRHCTGAIVNDKNVSLRYVLQNGDTVEILTSPHQEPKQDWMNYVSTSRAKTKLRQALREQTFRQAEIGKELLDRRLKNWKLTLDDATQRLLMKEYGYKDINVFFSAVGEEKITATEIKEFIDRQNKERESPNAAKTTSVENFKPVAENDKAKEKQGSVLILDKGLTDIDFSLAHCCNPIYGDPVFAFVSATGGVKIHRIGCHNEPEMRRKFGYRIIDAKWSGEDGVAMPVMLHVSGNDDIGIMSNISQLFSTEKDAKLRNINVDSTEGGFDGTITILVNNASILDAIVKKIRGVKGVRKVERLETK